MARLPPSKGGSKVNPRMLSVVLLLLVLSSSYTSKAGAEELGTFIPAGEMTKVRSAHTATLLTDGRVLVTGGSQGIAGSWSSIVLSAAEIYDPATGVFTTTGDLNAGRVHHTATLLSDGTVLVAGGLGGGILGSAELYDPSVGTFTPVGSMVTPQFQHTATLLPDGRVLVAGGGHAPNFPPFTVAGAEIYDPSTGLFTSTGSY
jgi:Galactose oxidase, central domain